MNKHNNWFKGILISIVSLLVISIAISIFITQTFFSSFRIIFGSIYVLFLPGFILSYLFFPKTKPFDTKEKIKGSIDWIERIALSFALSIAIVPLAVFYLNLIGVKISLLNSFLTILGIIAVSFGILYWRIRKQQE